MYDIIVFDCDGVLLNSNSLKTSAFRETIQSDSSENIQKFIQYHKDNGGLSRYKKFEFYHKNIAKNYTMKNLENSLAIYAKLVKQKLLSCDMIEGVENLLKELKANNIQCVVNTGSDEEELKNIFLKRNLQQYFDNILGSPNTKYENMDKLNLKNKTVLYFGDSKIDMEVSKFYNCDFIYVSGVSEWKGALDEITKYNYQVIEDFSKFTLKDIKKLYNKRDF